MSYENAHKGRGYIMRIHRDNVPRIDAEKRYAIGLDGNLPVEWSEIQQEPDVTEAEIYPNSRRRVKAVDKYTRG